MVKEMDPLRSRGYIDPGWEHGVPQDEKKKKVKCNHCGKVVSGGIFRLKQHLARISGEVTHCDKAPEEVCLNMKNNLEGCHSCRKRRWPESEQALICYSINNTEEKPSGEKWKGKKVMNDNSLNVNSAPLRLFGYVDPGWEHCIAQDEKKKRVKCIYCERVITGGINRFKQHLARIPGEVAYCKKAPEEVYLKIKENMKWHRTGRRNRKPETEESSAFDLLADNEDEEEEHDGGSFQCISIDDKVSDSNIRKSFKWKSRGTSSIGSEPLPRKSRLDSVFLKSLQVQMSPNHKQGKAKVGSERKPQKEVIAAISKFFYYAGIPSSAANSPYFHKLLELVGQYGQSLHGPLSRLISDRFLQDEISTTTAYLAELRETWMTTGCSVMADSWNDLHGRTRINFLASSPRGLYFISSFDASDVIADAGNLFKLLDKVVEEIGEENIVQVITKNTASFRTAGKMLEEKRKHLFWTPCAVHSIDGMLEDFMSINGLRETIDKAKRITRLIYNSSWLLNLFKKEFIKGQELLKPAVTKFGSTFLTIQSLLDQKIGLKRMFQSNMWICSQISKSEKAKEVERIVLNPTFWKKMQYVRKSLEPVAHVLLKLDSDGSNSMPFMYNDMLRSKLAIKEIHGNDARKYRPFWTVIDSHLNLLLHHPLYVAAYFLNPSYRYRPDFIMNPEVVRGLNECIVRLEPDSGRRISASLQIPDFVSAKVDFGTDLAISSRVELDPAAWWQQHGISCSELQQIAVRILSQTCSSIGCEHTWSVYDLLHSEGHVRAFRKKWNEHAYVHYNLRLRENQSGEKEEDFSFDSIMIESILGDWVAEVEKQAVLEDEEIICSENDIEQFYGDEVNENNPEEKKPADVLTLAGVADPVENNPAAIVNTDDDGLDFLQDNMTV